MMTKDERNDLILKLYSQGYNYREIGEQVGMSRQGVGGIIKQYRAEQEIKGLAKDPVSVEFEIIDIDFMVKSYVVVTVRGRFVGDGVAAVRRGAQWKFYDIETGFLICEADRKKIYAEAKTEYLQKYHQRVLDFRKSEQFAKAVEDSKRYKEKFKERQKRNDTETE